MIYPFSSTALKFDLNTAVTSANPPTSRFNAATAPTAPPPSTRTLAFFEAMVLQDSNSRSLQIRKSSAKLVDESRRSLAKVRLKNVDLGTSLQVANNAVTQTWGHSLLLFVCEPLHLPLITLKNDSSHSCFSTQARFLFGTVSKRRNLLGSSPSPSCSTAQVWSDCGGGYCFSKGLKYASCCMKRGRFIWRSKVG